MNSEESGFLRASMILLWKNSLKEEYSMCALRIHAILQIKTTDKCLYNHRIYYFKEERDVLLCLRILGTEIQKIIFKFNNYELHELSFFFEYLKS